MINSSKNYIKWFYPHFNAKKILHKAINSLLEEININLQIL